MVSNGNHIAKKTLDFVKYIQNISTPTYCILFTTTRQKDLMHTAQKNTKIASIIFQVTLV